MRACVCVGVLYTVPPECEHKRFKAKKRCLLLFVSIFLCSISLVQLASFRTFNCPPDTILVSRKCVTSVSSHSARSSQRSLIGRMQRERDSSNVRRRRDDDGVWHGSRFNSDYPRRQDARWTDSGNRHTSTPVYHPGSGGPSSGGRGGRSGYPMHKYNNVARPYSSANRGGGGFSQRPSQHHRGTGRDRQHYGSSGGGGGGGAQPSSSITNTSMGTIRPAAGGNQQRTQDSRLRGSSASNLPPPDTSQNRDATIPDAATVVPAEKEEGASVPMAKGSGENTDNTESGTPAVVQDTATNSAGLNTDTAADSQGSAGNVRASKTTSAAALPAGFLRGVE